MIGEFAGTTAHELGNPLYSVVMGTSLLLDSIDKKKSNIRSYIHSIRESAIECQKIIDGLFIAAGTKALNRRRVNVKVWLERVFMIMKPQLLSNKIILIKKYSNILPKISCSI